MLLFSLKHQLQDRVFFFQVFSSTCSRKHFYIISVYFLLGFKVRFTLRWLKSGKLAMAKHNSNKEGKRIKILFINEDIQPHCPELLHCLNGLTCWRRGAQCLTEAVQIFVGSISLGCLWFCIAAPEGRR